MGFIYDILLSIYQGIIKLIAPFHSKAKLWSEGRKGIYSKLEQALSSNQRDVAWFHCASLGEFEQGRPVIELFREKNPDYIIVITFFSPSGYEIRKNYDGADYIFYLPIDTKRNAVRFLDILKPKVAIFVKYEFWGNYLKELKRRGVKTYVISAIFRPSQLFFRSYGARYAKVLNYFSHLFVQNDESKELLKSVGVENVTVCGDTRFDRVYDIASKAQPLELFEKFSSTSDVFISGSSWEEDDRITLSLIEEFKNLKFIIAPHELKESKIKALESDIAAMGREVVRYTKIEDIDSASKCSVIIIDTIGILSKVYRYATYGYIGGGFGVGIHNTLEAATFGLPMIFGPNYKRFDEAVKLASLEVAQPIENQNDAKKWLTYLTSDKERREELSKRCKEYVESNIGACKTIIDHLSRYE